MEPCIWEAMSKLVAMWLIFSISDSVTVGRNEDANRRIRTIKILAAAPELLKASKCLVTDASHYLPNHGRLNQPKLGLCQCPRRLD